MLFPRNRSLRRNMGGRSMYRTYFDMQQTADSHEINLNSHQPEPLFSNAILISRGHKLEGMAPTNTIDKTKSIQAQTIAQTQILTSSAKAVVQWPHSGWPWRGERLARLDGHVPCFESHKCTKRPHVHVDSWCFLAELEES